MKMESVDVISISDTESSAASSIVLVNGPLTELEKIPLSETFPQNNEDVEVLTLSSVSRRSTERCPVTWTKFAKQPKLHFLNEETFTSPSPRAKVTHWLSENANNGQPNVNTPDRRVFLEPRVVENCSTDDYASFSTTKSSIIVRQDYKKSNSSEFNNSSEICVVDNVVNTGQNRIIYVEHTSEREDLFSVIQSNLVQNPKEICDEEQADVDIEEIPNSTPISVKSLVENLQQKLQTAAEREKNLDTSKLSTCTNNPLSPENQKKIELCQYLKLMTMTSSDTRPSRKTQNRRSTRVKHLALMSEKRQLERQLNSEMQSELERKKSMKISDADSRHSFDNDRGSKTSKRSSTSTGSSKTSSERASPTQKSPTEENKQNRRPQYTERRYSVTLPSKSLQVPEVSTTSIFKNKNSEFKKFLQNNKNPRIGEINNLSNMGADLRKSDSDIDYHNDNRINNSIITEKSFEQINMNVDSLQSLRNMRSQSIGSLNICTDPDRIRFSLVKSVANVPNDCCDFDETIKIILHQEMEKIISPMHKNAINHPSVDEPDENFETSTRKRKIKTTENIPKPKIRRFTRGRKKLKSKKKKFYMKPKSNFNKKRQLRSNSLKQFKRKKMQEKTKRASRRKLRLQQTFLQEKDFKTAELIQHGSEKTPTKELPTTPTKPTPTKTPPTSIRNCLPEAEVWKKYFTSEHRKAYIESIQYLEEAQNAKKSKMVVQKEDSPPCYGFNATEIQTDELQKLQVTCENFKNSIIFKPYVGTFPERNRPSLEDLEVDQLMSRRKRMDDQETQNSCELVDLDQGRNSYESDLTPADHSRCSSSTAVSSSANSWSLQTVESNPEASTSTARHDLKIPCRSLSNSVELPTTPISNTKSTTPFSHDDSSSRVSVVPPEIINISQIPPTTCPYITLPTNGGEVKSLHYSLTQPKIKLKDKSKPGSPIHQRDWEERLRFDKSPKSDRKSSQSHSIYLSNINGAVMSAYYLDFNIIIVQELLVSFWNQSPLGQILGSQDMWINKGSVRRMVLGNGCVHKESSETVISLEDSIAYIELWTKEHKSDKRERPVADVFITIYLRLSRSGPDKKVLQLENIHGYANDVQYIVLKNARCIIVSWSVSADTVSSTLVHCYHLSPDYQTVTSITKMQTVDHYVSSLHNVEDCDTIVLGCGDFKSTIWDLEHGYVISTIDLVEINPQPRTLWAKCDRGFLFTVHLLNDDVLQLIAINSFDCTWKILQTYKSELEYENLLGVCMENGILVAFYDTGVSCWSAQTGIPMLEDTTEDSGVLLPYGKHVVVVLNNQVHVRHALEYLITLCPIEEV